MRYPYKPILAVQNRTKAAAAMAVDGAAICTLTATGCHVTVAMAAGAGGEEGGWVPPQGCTFPWFFP